MANNPNNVEAAADAVEQMEVDPNYLQLVTAILKNSGTTINDMLQTAGITSGDNPTEGDIQYLGNLFLFGILQRPPDRRPPTRR